MKKLFLSVIAMLCCGLAWSQTTWSSGSGTEADPYLILDTNDFKKIDNGGDFYAGKYFKQMADLNFGNVGTKEHAFIRIFAGIYDGNGKSISYNGTFTGQQHGDNPDEHNIHNAHGDYGLFGRVTNGGIIKNLNVNAQIVFTAKEGAANANMNAGLLCGHLDNGTISYCNVTGEVASQINASNGGGGDVGLLCGQSEGREEYCTGAGTVTGHGWVGGLIGAQHKGSIYACSFEGSVTAVTPEGNSCDDGQVTEGYGSFAGGIVGVTGYTKNQQGQTAVHVDVSFCVANADVSAGCVASGVASLAVGGRSATVKNCIGSGTVNGSKMTAEVTNSTDTNSNYTTNGKTEEEIQQIIDALNNAATGTGIEFGNSNGNIIIYPDGKPKEPCTVPTNLVITKTESGVSASWEGSASGYETRLTGGDLTSEQTPTETMDKSWAKTSLPASVNEYVFSVRAKCSDGTKPENQQSDWVSSSFTIDCPEVSNLQMQEKTSNSLTITLAATTDELKLILKKGETEVRSITTGLNSPYTITGLEANTAYTISLSARCGNDYVNPQQITLTTNKPSVPQNLKAEPYYDGAQNKGKVAIQWDAVEEAGEYEYELSGSNNATIETTTIANTSFTKDSCDLGAYNIKVRSKQGGAYSDWSNTLSFVISNPLAPKNPKTTFAVNQDDNSKKDVTVSWEAGNTEQTPTSWTINGYNVSYNTNPSYTFSAQEPGSRLEVSIVENIEGGNSAALTFPINVPCLDMAAPDTSDITQTSATINGLANGDKIYFGGSEQAMATASSYSFSDLLPGTHYDVEVRRYCNETNGIYSAQKVAFTTYACSKPKNLSSSNISTTSATITWDRGNGNLDLSFELKLFKNGEPTAVQTINNINGTTYTFNTLLPGTSYKVSIAEECQNGYGDPVNHTFTTKAGNFVAVNTGQWSSTSTWENGQIPTCNEANIIINPDVNVTLGSGTLKLTDTYTLTNNGTLTLTASSQIINLSGNNNLGKVSLPAATVGEQKKWSLIGAPFASSYKLEAIEPVSNSDVAVVLYDYGQGKWSTDWATVTDSVQQGEAFFAWPFYSGNITFSTKLESSTETGYLLNNGDVTISKNIVNSENGNWLPLANPYPAVLSAKKFTAEISDLQGKGVYLYNTNTSMFEQKTLASTNPDVEIGLCTGFFINFSSAGDKSVTFKKEHLRDWPTPTAKSCCKNGSREVVEIDLEHNYINVPLYFVHNLEAEQGYDIWDANKLFSTSGIPEPYFVTEGVNLVKEEVNELPYYATVNIRSEKDTVVTLIAKTIPEGYAVSLIDGEQETDLNEGGRYPIEITTGENADRFKLLVRKNVGLEEVANTDIKISNNNRHITITAQDKVKVSVYNALGQKVYETAKSIFTLEGVAAGAYVIKVQSGNAVQSQKVIIR